MNISNIYLLLLALLAAACAPESPSAQPQPSSAEPAEPGFYGLVYAASDAGGVPDVPLASQVILAIPAAAAGDTLGSSLDPGQLRFLKVELRQEEALFMTTLSGPDGTYSLPLEAGEYVLCLGESQGQPGSYPISLRGCGLAMLAEGEKKRINFSSGFGEVLLEEK
jgi:hypothetical protein